MNQTRAGRLKDKVAIITGAASGIGRATAVLFAREGATIVLADMQEKALQETLAMAKEAGGAGVAQKTNVAVEAEVQALVNLAVSTYGPWTSSATMPESPVSTAAPRSGTAKDWQRVYAVNVLGAVFMTKHATKHLIASQRGAIVNTASVAGIRSGAGGNAYSASKGALINFTMTSACDLGGFNVRVNAVCPGLIETGMTKPVFDYARAKGKEEKLGSRCELRRYGRPEEVAGAILFLASDEASYITGQALPVDGGNTASLNLPGMKV